MNDDRKKNPKKLVNSVKYEELMLIENVNHFFAPSNSKMKNLLSKTRHDCFHLIRRKTSSLLDSFGPDVLRQPGVDADVLSVHGLLGELLDLFDRSRGTPLVRAKNQTMNVFLMYKPDLQLVESRD